MSTTTQRIEQLKPAWKDRFQVPLYVAALGGVGVTAVYAPEVIRFWPFSAAEFLQRITPLFLISLFIERSIEVFLTAWRGPDAAIRSHKLKALRKAVAQGKTELEEDLVKACVEHERCRSRMQRMAFAASVALGMVISAVGVRALGMFVDASAFGSLSKMQQTSFNIVDVLLTGAVLGGGSDALHKFVTVFTNFMERTARQVKGDVE
jgi:hypothetical protein